MTFLSFWLILLLVGGLLLAILFFAGIENTFVNIVLWIGITSFVIGFICMIVWLGFAASETQTEARCGKWGKSANIETKFVKYDTFNFICFGEMDGKWLPTDQIRASINDGK